MYLLNENKYFFKLIYEAAHYKSNKLDRTKGNCCSLIK